MPVGLPSAKLQLQVWATAADKLARLEREVFARQPPDKAAPYFSRSMARLHRELLLPTEARDRPVLQQALVAVCSYRGDPATWPAPESHRGWLDKARASISLRNDLSLALADIETLGFKIDNIRNLSERHVRAVVRYWEDKRAAAATMRRKLSALRMLAKAIGRFTVGTLASYVADPMNALEGARVGVLSRAHARYEHLALDIPALLNLAYQADPVDGLRLGLMVAFGAKRTEAAIFQPHQDIAPDQSHIIIRAARRRAQSRRVEVTASLQRVVIDRLCHWRTQNPQAKGLRYEGSTWAKDLNRFNATMARIGVTGKKLGITPTQLAREYAYQALQQRSEEVFLDTLQHLTGHEALMEAKRSSMRTRELTLERSLPGPRAVRAQQFCLRIEARGSSIAALMAMHGVTQLWLSGRQASGEMNPRSKQLDWILLARFANVEPSCAVDFTNAMCRDMGASVYVLDIHRVGSACLSQALALNITPATTAVPTPRRKQPSQAVQQMEIDTMEVDR
jgi:hypothetical protein